MTTRRQLLGLPDEPEEVTLTRRQFSLLVFISMVMCSLFGSEFAREWLKKLMGGDAAKEIDAYEFRLGSYSQLVCSEPGNFTPGMDVDTGGGTLRVVAVDNVRGTITLSGSFPMADTGPGYNGVVRL